VYCSLFRYEQKGVASLVQHEHLWEQDQSRGLSKAQAGSGKEDAARKINFNRDFLLFSPALGSFLQYNKIFCALFVRRVAI